MATYIIGDIQGCYRELQELLERIQFNVDVDRLGFVGDLVNRGPDSLEVLRFIHSLKNPMIVLGNHDLYLLILGYGLIAENAYPHTLQKVLKAPDKGELLDWMREQPLLHYDETNKIVLVHAGLPPQWSIAENREHAAEVQGVLRGPRGHEFLAHLFGNEPIQWSPRLTGQNRWRYMTNAFTRMRFCNSSGNLDLKNKEPLMKNKEGYLPWYQWRDPKVDGVDIIFGHWAALNGECETPHCYALDTGCGWGRHLTALCLETRERISVPCSSMKS